MTSPFTWTDAEVCAALGFPGGRETPVFSQVSTDTRTLEPGALFVALVGERFDAHDFAAQAVEAGAAGVVVDRPVELPAEVMVYQVPDTLVALGELARHRREALPARVVGITGSSGKTSTKEFIRAALGGHFRVHATPGNLNNRIGVPLTLLSAPEDADVLVVEMGTNEPGEIGRLAHIGRPDVAVLITVGEAHLEKLGSLEGVLEEKLDIIRGMAPGGVAIVGDTPDFLPPAARALHPGTRVAGLNPTADPELRPNHLTVDAQGRYGFRWHGETVGISIAGRHMAANAVLALAVARELGVPAPVAAAGVSSAAPEGMRGEERRFDGLTVVVDCYNANPQSTRAALDSLASRTGSGPRVAFLGSMLELGEESARYHDEVLAHALALELDAVVATGLFAEACPDVDRPDLLRHEDPDAAYALLRPVLTGAGMLLLKGSRGVALERLLPLLEADAQRGAGNGAQAVGGGV